MKNFKKQFEVTESSNGNILVIDHHSKPSKDVKVFNSSGVFVNDISERDFNKVKHFEGSIIVSIPTNELISDVAAFHILCKKKIKENANKLEVIENEINEGVYEVEIKVMPLEGHFYYKTLIFTSNSIAAAREKAASDYWANPKWDSIKIWILNVELIK